jgi:hypothetical protein
VAAREEVPVPIHHEVPGVQRTTAALDAAHRLVPQVQAGRDKAVADMANQVSAEFAGQLLALEVAEVSRLAKACSLGTPSADSFTAQRPKAEPRCPRPNSVLTESAKPYQDHGSHRMLAVVTRSC